MNFIRTLLNHADRIRYLFYTYEQTIIDVAFIFLLSILTFTLLLLFFRSNKMSRILSSGRSKKISSAMASTLNCGVFITIMIVQVYWMRTNNIWSGSLDEGPLFTYTYLSFRFVHIACLAMVIIATGLLFFQGMRKFHFKIQEFRSTDLLILSFFAGAALWRIFMFALGYMQGYYLEFLLPLTIIIYVAGHRYLAGAFHQFFITLHRTTKNLSREEMFLATVLGSATLFLLFFVFLFNTIYSNNINGDYITHYGPYFDLVVKNHGIWPNEIWYQYFYSKGEGVAFLSMILSDKHGKHFVALLFFTFSCFTIFRMVQKATKDRLWAALAVIVVASIFVLDDSGSFEKHHAVVGSLLLAITYCFIMAWESKVEERPFWLVTGAIFVVAQVIMSPPAFAYVGVLLGTSFLLSIYIRQFNLSIITFVWIVAGTLAAFLIIFINYITTGMPEGTPFALFVKFIDFERFGEWVSPYMISYILETTTGSFHPAATGDMGGSLRAFIEKIPQILAVLRFDKIISIFFLHPVIFLGMALLVIIRPSGVTDDLKRVVWGCVAVIFSVVLGAMFVNQPVSVYRASAFVIFFITILSAILGYLFVKSCLRQSVHRFALLLFVLIILLKSGIGAAYVTPKKFQTRIDYLLGRYTLAEAFEKEYHVSKVFYDMRTKIGIDNRLLFVTVSVETGLAHFIGNGVATEFSYSLGNKWHLLVFEDAKTAREEYQKLGINYFMIRATPPQFGALAASDLFAPYNIRENFKVIWSYGPFYVMTWRTADDPKGDRPTENLVRLWSSMGEDKITYEDVFLRTRYLYWTNNSSTKGDINRPLYLPEVTGWQ